jgi:hypothetical protein
LAAQPGAEGLSEPDQHPLHEGVHLFLYKSARNALKDQAYGNAFFGCV